MPHQALRIAVIEDHVLVRQALVTLIHATTDARVVLEAGDGLEYEQACATGIVADIAIVDLFMPVRNGFETIAWMVAYQPHTLPLACSADVEPPTIRSALLAGSRGYLPKNTDRHELPTAFEQLRTTGYYNSPLVQPHREALASEGRVQARLLASLTEREVQVLRLLCNPGVLSYKQIAAELGIGKRTVETHIVNLCAKLEVHGRLGLVLTAIRWGLVKV